MCMSIYLQREHFRVAGSLTSNSFLIVTEGGCYGKGIQVLERVLRCVPYANLRKR